MHERELASNEVYPWNSPSVASKLPWFSHGELAHDSPPVVGIELISTAR